MKLHSKIRFFCPLIALFSCMVLMLQAHALLSAPVIGLLAFLLVQWLYNTTRQPRHPDGSKELEQMTSAQMNDPALAGAAARGGDRGGAFMPTRDIRANDLQRTTVGSWLSVCLTLLGSIGQADPYLHSGPMTLEPYRLYALWIVLLFLCERVALWQERR